MLKFSYSKELEPIIRKIGCVKGILEIAFCFLRNPYTLECKPLCDGVRFTYANRNILYFPICQKKGGNVVGISEYNSKLTFDFLLNVKESQYFDRKSATIKISKLAEAIVGFANADGGIIVVGIKDNKIHGVFTQGNTKINDILQCGFEKCIPSVNYKFETVQALKDNGKEDEIILLHIEPSIDKVHKTEGDEVFLRVGDETKKLNFEQRVDLEYDKNPTPHNNTLNTQKSRPFQ